MEAASDRRNSHLTPLGFESCQAGAGRKTQKDSQWKDLCQKVVNLRDIVEFVMVSGSFGVSFVFS